MGNYNDLGEHKYRTHTIKLKIGLKMVLFSHLKNNFIALE